MKINCSMLCRGTILAVSSAALLLAAASAQIARAQNSTEAQSAAQQSSAAPSRIPARVTQKVDDQNVVPLHGGVHRMARTEFDRGAVTDSQPADHMIVTLKRSKDQEIALRQLLVEQQDKSSKNYHAWLTPDQFGQQFGPSDSDVQAVTDWLTSRGFSNLKVSPGRTRVEFSGNIGQVRNAFHTDVHNFMVNGKMHMAAISDVQVPAALAPVIAGVVSLHDFRPKAHAHKLGTFRRNKETGEVKPLFTFTGCGSSGAQPCYAVGPGDFAKTYNVPATVTGPAPGNVVAPSGTGATIGIVQDSNFNVADVKSYRTLFGLPDNFSASNIVLNGPDPGIQGPDSLSDDEIEADLDVQIAGGVAPAANIQLVVSEDSQSIGASGIDLSAIYIIDNNSADILSESFGACEPNITASNEGFYNDLWQQATAQGITVVLSSGDSGSDSCDQGANEATTGISVSGLASTEFNVAVGDTDFLNGAIPSPFWNPASTTTTSALTYIPETTWNNSCAATAVVGTLTTCAASPNPDGRDLVAAGGGPSVINAKPVWQTGIPGNPADTFRDLPDISLFAGNGFHGSFYIICQQDANTGTGSTTSSCDLNSPFNDFQGVGGTSAGAPAFAGIMALVKQKTGQRQGNANFILYQLFKKNTAGTICSSAAGPASTCIFYDIPATPVGTSGANISVACQGGTPNCSNTSTAANQFGVLVVDPTKPTTTTPAFVTTANYDLATGLGSLNVNNLVNNWGSATFTGDTLTISSTSPSNLTSPAIAHGTSVTFNLNISPTAATGPVSLIAQPAGKAQVGIGTFSENSTAPFAFNGTSGTVTIQTNALPGGTNYPVVASYAGDGTFQPKTSAPVMVTVTPENSKTVVTLQAFDSSGNVITPAPSSVPYGSAYIVQIAVQNNAGSQCASVVVACPTGTVTITDNGAPLNDFSGSNSAKLNTLGIAEDQPIQLGVGTHSLIAAYAGDNSFNASTSAADTFAITKATPTGISVSPSLASVTVGQNVTLTATISTSSSGIAPTGTVTFSAGGTTLGTGPVNGSPASGLNGNSPQPASGTATLQTSFSTSGAKSITATYSGDTTYNSVGPAAATTVTVNAGSQASSTVVTSSVTSIASGSSITLTATVTGTSGGTAPTGSVQFMNGTSPLGTAATCTASSTAATCTASLTTTLASLPPSTVRGPRNTPDVPLRPVYILTALLLLACLMTLRYAPPAKRLRYASIGVVLFACIAIGIAGCGGGSSSGGGGGGVTPHTDSITAVYSGDASYSPSTSAAVSISIH